MVVEHDKEMIESADYLLDIGPGAGRLGGEIVWKGTPKEILKQRKKFRSSVFVRNIYTEVLNILQADVMQKLKNKRKSKEKKYLDDAMMTSIAGISAAMKNTG